jgi:hypothetical protein
MTNKVYRSAQGKLVDLGALLLQNEQVRAVGNMNVNARGDLLDGNNTIIDKKNDRVQRQYNRQTQSNVTTGRVATSNAALKKIQQDLPTEDPVVDPLDAFEPVDPTVDDVQEPEVATSSSIPKGGLAAAIARSKEIKQELEKTPRQQAQSQGLKKI